MRLFALVMLLANLATLTWMRNFSETSASQLASYPVSQADLGTGLVLAIDPDAVQVPAGETDASIAMDTPPTDGTGVPAEASTTSALDEEITIATSLSIDSAVMECAELGPFSNEDLASMAAVRLRDIGYQPTLRESGGQIRSGFWVYLPPYQSRQEAEQAVSDLRAQGVTDLFVVTGSEQLNAVSLGLFSNGSLADRRAAAIGKIGYTPKIVEHFRDATVFWIEYRENPDDPLTPEDVGVFANAYELPEKKEIICGSG